MPTLSEDKSVLSWASTLEPAALVQAQTTASMPFVNKPLALMPDAHLGRGSTIGSVIATEGDIDQVMLDQQDLVEPVYTLRQILNYKGTK